jgi:Lon protease-like protein
MLLPRFPLHAVLFPHLPMPLQLFEDRYLTMAADLVADASPYDGRLVIGMITEGREVGGAAATRSVGTICEVRSAERHADGRWTIVVVGLMRARLGRIDASGPYELVDAEPLDEPIGDGVPPLRSVQQALDDYLAAVKRFVARTASVREHADQTATSVRSLDTVLPPIRLPDDPVAASYAVGGVLQVELLRKQRLLELPDAGARLRAELELLRREARLLDDGELPTVPASDLGYHPN